MENITKASQWMEEGRVEEALSLLKKTSVTATDENKFLIAEVLEEWGFLEEAIRILEDLFQSYPNEGQLITKLAELYIDAEKDDIAIQLLNELDSTDEFYVSSLLLLADLYQVQGLFEVSEQKLFEAKKLAPQEYVIDFALGELFFSIGQYSRAIPFYEKVYEQKDEINSVSMVERLAECHALTGHYEEALDYYNKMESDDPDILFKYGFTASQMKRNDIAIRVWKQLIEKDPYYHSVYYELASVMEKENMTEEAYEIAEKGLLYDEFDKEIYFIAGKLALKLDDRDKSMEYMKRAIELDSDYKDAILFLVQLYKETDRNKEIIELMKRVNQSDGTDPLYKWELARAYVEEELFVDALSLYKEIESHFSQDSDFLKEYGYFLVEEGQMNRATSILKQYINIVPDDEEVIMFLERLNFSNNI